ncbi:MAG: DUF1499 domain-containing protein [Acidobacteria bacterium]|nr:DUF1499 domain-containing protein [Acidobacteriota bacterium]
MRLALVACGAAAAGLLLLAIAGPSYRIGLLSLASASALLGGAMYVGLAGVAAGALAGVLAYRRRARLATFLAAVAAIGGIGVAAIPFEWQRRARAAPPIHDISTDLENPPAFDDVVPLRGDDAARLDRSREVAAQQRETYPDLAPVVLPVPLDQAFTRALAAAQDAGWRIVAADQGTGRIEATDTTIWFGFTDDIVVRLTPWGAGTRVDVRSVSRDREHDMGSNARRIRRYLAALQ